MPSKSFRRDIGSPPLRYRTPSPPRFAFEPISPIEVDNATAKELGAPWSSQDQSCYGPERPQYAQSKTNDDIDKQEDGFRGPMDAFASIALAANRASATQVHPSLVYSSSRLAFKDESHEAERPSKRARSEKLQSPEWPREIASAGTRPATSYEQSSDSRTFEAELLLNFCQKARFASSQVVNSQVDLDSSQGNYGLPLSPSSDSKPPPSNTYGPENQGPDGFANPVAEQLSDGGMEDGVMEDEVSEIIIGTSDVVHQPERPKEYDLLPTAPADEHHEVDGIDGSRTRQEIESRDGHDERASFPEVKEMDTMDDNGTDNYAVVALPSGSRDASVQAVGATFSNSGEKSPSSENGELQGQSQDSTPDELEASTASINDPFESDAPAGLEDIVTINQEESPDILSQNGLSTAELKSQQTTNPATCSACHFSRNSPCVDSENSSTSWISCDGCKSWFHFACAGFKSEREVRSVDKYRCRKCKHEHGPTTYVRKSARAHSAIDYAGLNQGVIKTSDERPEHHYIKPIKDGVITFLPETFARMRPELVTADFFEKGDGMKEPIVIPASLNPRPKPVDAKDPTPDHEERPETGPIYNPSIVEEWLSRDAGLHRVLDHGQDALDMVMPQNLTVRIVSELYGPEERVEVIDVKSQNGEGKKWNMRRWADYYESSDNKAVRNVISLEVSQSMLGRLIRRPRIVRELDLQDSVWPQELQQKGEYPRVQLYCLMSVADCFTDFHIDFGGSSVFYHILKGKKIFLFIPPKEKHLKKYEEWCRSPAQNWTFLADQTKECYRVDLAEGDTMLIPAGWIHAVWTPEDSLVIGGNFLTRMHYGMQIRIAQIEKTTGVSRRFRYPHFQKLHWYTALQYLKDDPLPDNVKELVQEGGTFHRERPAHFEFDTWGENSNPGFENYHSRYYAKAELEGLPDLTRYLLRTALIDLGSITEGITTETRNAVKKSIPRGHGEPLDILKEFAMWCAWKRGNEQIPHWAYPHAVPEGGASDSVGKLSAAALKKDAALQAPRRQSTRRQTQKQVPTTPVARSLSEDIGGSLKGVNEEGARPADFSNPTTPIAPALTTPSKRKVPDLTSPGGLNGTLPDVSKKRRKSSTSRPVSRRKPACDLCRKRRRACKHRVQDNISTSDAQPSEQVDNTVMDGLESQKDNMVDTGDMILTTITASDGEEKPFVDDDEQESSGFVDKNSTHSPPRAIARTSKVGGSQEELQPSNNETPTAQASSTGILVRKHALASGPITPSVEGKKHGSQRKGSNTSPANILHSRGRSKACNDCRKSKRRCIHDENGNEDPVKIREAAVPRPAATIKRRKLDSGGHDARLIKKPQLSTKAESLEPTRILPASPPSASRSESEKRQLAPVATAAGHDPRSTGQQTRHMSLPISVRDTKLLLLTSPRESVHQTRADGPDFVDGNSSPPVLESNLTVTNASHQDNQQHRGDSEDQVHLISVNSPSSQKGSLAMEAPFLEHHSSVEQPAASLVSPPASAHDDAEKSPVTNQPSNLASSTSSRHSSRHPKHVQRYTPESGPARRASSSSVGDVGVGKSTAAAVTVLSVRTDAETPRAPKDLKANPSPEAVADEESLKLIKELQAEEHGLRRRGRVL